MPQFYHVKGVIFLGKVSVKGWSKGTNRRFNLEAQRAKRLPHRAKDIWSNGYKTAKRP